MISVGQIVGNYKVMAPLGVGGMGTVFLAEHPIIGSKVALKAIHPQFAGNPEIVARFVNEAKAVNQIGHDHIINITDFGSAPTGDFYFMMEYLEGDTLADAIRRSGRFSPARAFHIAAQIADALGASHAQGIIHRDLKPENIVLIVRDGLRDFVKVLDFGLAKLTHRSRVAPYQSAAGWVMGTPYYMSPEQCEGRAEIDHRSDIYALGVILFEMVTGLVPFGTGAPGDILAQHINTPPPSGRSVVPDLPPAVDAILARSLAKDPARRFQTMAEFREALLGLEPQEAVYASPSLREQAHVLRDQPAAGMVTGEPALVPRPLSRPSPSPLATPLPLAATELTPGLTPRPSPVPQTRAARLPRASGHRAGAAPGAPGPPARQARHPVRSALLAAGALVVALVAGVKYHYRATDLLEGVAAGVPAHSRPPARIRLTFNSEPQGATVIRSDGRVVGVTPVVAEVPSGLEKTEYVFEKAGFLSKTASVVPETSLSIFEALAPATPRAPAAVAANVVQLPRLDPPAPVPRVIPPAARRPRPRRSIAPDAPARPTPPAAPMPTTPRPPPRVVLPVDRDDVLAPSES